MIKRKLNIQEVRVRIIAGIGDVPGLPVIKGDIATIEIPNI